MKKIVILLAIAMLFVSCANAHKHIIGNGKQTGASVTRRQWYALWGLVPIGDAADTKIMAAGAQDYEIYTRANAADVIINIFTRIVSITSRTVTVTH